MNVRYFGGPMHNKTQAIQDYHDCIQYQRRKPNRIKWNFNAVPPQAFMPPLQIGKYWRTGDVDKHGNTIYAWSGWR